MASYADFIPCLNDSRGVCRGVCAAYYRLSQEVVPWATRGRHDKINCPPRDRPLAHLCEYAPIEGERLQFRGLPLFFPPEVFRRLLPVNFYGSRWTCRRTPRVRGEGEGPALEVIKLPEERGWSREQANVICSVAVDLRVSQVVDVPNVTVSALLPEDIFRG